MLCTLIGAIMLSINIQVGLDLHLYDDIGDASSSLRGSTSSLKSYQHSMLFNSYAIVKKIKLCDFSYLLHVLKHFL